MIVEIHQDTTLILLGFTTPKIQDEATRALMASFVHVKQEDEMIKKPSSIIIHCAKITVAKL